MAKQNNKRKPPGSGIGIGLVFGVAFGLASDSIVLGAALGSHLEQLLGRALY